MELEDEESDGLIQGRADIAHFFVSVLRCRWSTEEVIPSVPLYPTEDTDMRNVYMTALISR